MRLNNTELLKFALSFADISKSILQKNYFKKFNIEEKNDGSLVTNIDKEIEEKFRKHLKRKFPEHGIIGEEFGYEKEDNEYVWILDPLDGTHSFIAGKPLFGTLICCALPILLVKLGMGASLAGLIGAAPWITVISDYKRTIFIAAGILLILAALMLWRARNAPCPLNPEKAKACSRLRRLSWIILTFSIVVYVIGFFFAFLAVYLVV